MEKELYFLITLNSQTREQFFETEFGFYNSDSDTTEIEGIKYSIDRIKVNGEQFLIKGCEIVKCTQIIKEE